MEVYDFLPTYTEFDKDTQNIIESIVGRESSSTSLYHKKEFHDYKLEKIEDRPADRGVYLNHQRLMARFLSSHTPYKGILVMHEPGTGKTCLSVAVIEQIISEGSLFRGALILMKGKNLISNYKKELVEQCTDGKYDLDETERKLNPNQRKRRLNKKLSDFYQFQTFEIFSKQLATMKDEKIKALYSNIIIVIDEAHHLRAGNEVGQYNNIYKMLHLVENCKTILMTGTPMIDNPSEIASMMNLILDQSQQLPIGNEFEETYMTKKDGIYVLDETKEEELKERLHGRVSFLRSMQSTVSRKFVGEKIDLKYFNQFGLPMESFQLEHYEKALTDDEKEKGVYNSSREASLFVFPNGSYGKKGYDFHTKISDNRVVFKKEVPIITFTGKTIEEKLADLSKQSVKYANCIRILLEEPGNHFVYLDLVHGSGALVFVNLLQQFGFVNFKQPGNKRFALLTSTTSSTIEEAIQLFNSNGNVDGSKIKVIIGTDVISEGFTLKNVRHVHILTPHWNFSKTDQIIARAFRLFSHQALLEKYPEFVVKIYLYTALTNPDTDDESIKSIDRYMYKFCEDKDISIKSIEHLLKQVSFDCRLTKERNRLPKSFNYTRNCEYEKCNYTCYPDEDDNTLDLSTYHMHYDMPDILRVMKAISRLFIDRTYYSLNELIERLDESLHLIIKTILYMSEHKVILHDQHGIHFYLYYDQDWVYLSSKLKDTELFDHFYVDHLPLQLFYDFNHTVSKVYHQNLPKLFRQMKDEVDVEKKKTLLSLFSDRAKELMIEFAVFSKNQQYEEVDPVREYILQQFASVIAHHQQYTVSSMLGKDQLRCLEDGKDEWKACGKDITLPKPEVKKNIYGYESIYEDGVFKIKTQQEQLPTDGRKQYKGENCEKMVPKTKHLTILHDLKIGISDAKKQDKKYKALLKKSEDDLKEMMEENQDLETFLSKKLAKTDIVSLLYWNTLPKKELCHSIESFFKEKGI